VDPRENQLAGRTITTGVVIFTVIFIVTALTNIIFVLFPELGLARRVRVGAEILMAILILSGLTMEFIGFVKRRRQEHRDRAERDAGLM
jgi:hypothetical protein